MSLYFRNGIPAKEALAQKEPFVACIISAFDGMLPHHHQLISAGLSAASDDPFPLVAMIVEPPDTEPTKYSPRPFLLTRDEKIALLAAKGVNHCVVWKMEAGAPPTSQPTLPANVFRKIQILIPGADIWGDHHQKKLLIHAVQQHPLLKDKTDHRFEHVSTRDYQEVCHMIHKGKVAEAAGILGSPYQLEGKVVQGNKLGRKLGYPTANLAPGNNAKILPGKGVYLAKVMVDKKWHPGLINIGTRPTLAINQLSIEAHLLNFSKEIYHKTITIRFLDRIRDEQRFNSLSALQHQINKDIKAAEEILKKRGER